MATEKLPQSLLEKASLRGKEYAWPLAVIPEVIEAARKANLLNIGGQLQFRIPDGGTCDCYWVGVYTYKSVPENLPWAERVDLAAKVALEDFQILRETSDFLAEGREGFSAPIDEYINAGGDINTAMCFVWYLSTE